MQDYILNVDDVVLVIVDDSFTPSSREKKSGVDVSQRWLYGNKCNRVKGELDCEWVLRSSLYFLAFTFSVIPTSSSFSIWTRFPDATRFLRVARDVKRPDMLWRPWSNTVRLKRRCLYARRCRRVHPVCSTCRWRCLIRK